jgi:hypothetical protein
MSTIAEIKAAVLAAGQAIGTGTSTFLGQEVSIRAITVTEESAHLTKGVAAGAIPICAACIVDGLGEPIFTKQELGALKAGSLTDVYRDIINLSYPKTETIKKKS